jgi:hypothetical protein
MASLFGLWLVLGHFGWTTLTGTLGCNKSSSGSASEFFVVIGPPDMNTDTGVLTEAALEKIKQASDQSNVAIRMSGHLPLSDRGLAQLAQFKNIHRVVGVGSRVTPAGIDKLKKAIPEVEVIK